MYKLWCILITYEKNTAFEMCKIIDKRIDLSAKMNQGVSAT